jgi:stress response protein SCP2
LIILRYGLNKQQNLSVNLDNLTLKFNSDNNNISVNLNELVSNNTDNILTVTDNKLFLNINKQKRY